jgi:hypothetical protein
VPYPILEEELIRQRKPSPHDIYQIKVTLLDTKPPIWRRLQVPADLTLAQLHNVLQIAMGWDDEHMHEFRVGQRRFGRPEPADPFMRMPLTESERTARLSVLTIKPLIHLNGKNRRCFRNIPKHCTRTYATRF